jgi:CRP-like cAMP-binding protein
MEINLLLTATKLQLAPHLTLSEEAGGVRTVKNTTERTYLNVTARQWRVLLLFQEAQTVPRLLETVLEQRLCPALGELYELVLKAVRARILVEPGQVAATVPAANWGFALRPDKLRHSLGALLAVGLVLTLALHPALPPTFLAAGISLAALAAAVLAGGALAAALVCGAGGEVYLSHGWLPTVTDLPMLTPRDQRVALGAPIALLAATTGFLAWHRPEWSLFPLVGLLVSLRPIFHGRISRMIWCGAQPRLSDAEHDFIFPLNRTPRQRWQLLKFGLRHRATWKEIGYGFVWTLALGYFVGVLTEVPPWTLTFWQTRGPWLFLSVVAALGLLGVIYLGSEVYLYARERAVARHNTFREWHRRWLRRDRPGLSADDKLRAALRSPLLRQFPPPEQAGIAALLEPHRVGPWRTLHNFDAPVSHVSLILSGKVGVYRQLPSGRRTLVQTLCEDDLVGLHAAADPAFPRFQYRTLTPVTLLRLDWAQAEALIVRRVGPGKLSTLVHKLPFLTRISLCQNWHVQAIQRFAELSTISNYRRDDVMLQEGSFNENFFVMLEGEARILRQGKLRGKVSGGAFFGEIGLLQNSNATASVIANEGARVLCIQRREFLRFVAHNYSVALELERVSSQRLGRPIFPMVQGDFRGT